MKHPRPLTKVQKARLCQDARTAWERSGAAAESASQAAAGDPFGMPGPEGQRFGAWRRNQQLQAVGKASLCECDQRDYRPLLGHFYRLAAGHAAPDEPAPAGHGWPADKHNEPGNLWSADKGPQLRKIGKLLGTAGRPWSYAHAMALRMAKVERLDWAAPRQLRLIILALEKDGRRHDAQPHKQTQPPQSHG